MVTIVSNKKSGGRVTPKHGTKPGGSTQPSRARKSSPRPAKDEPLPQVGRRPSNPFLLFAIAGMWLVGAVVIWSTFTVSWKLVPAVVAAGIGLLFLRGAVLTVARHEERATDDDA